MKLLNVLVTYDVLFLSTNRLIRGNASVLQENPKRKSSSKLWLSKFFTFICHSLFMLEKLKLAASILTLRADDAYIAKIWEYPPPRDSA